MREFDRLDPSAIHDDPRIVARMRYLQDGEEEEYFVLIDGSHALLVDRGLYQNPKTGVEKWLSNQVELPKGGIAWIVETLEQKFFKTSKQGGLPKGSLHHRESVEGEELALNRGAATGGAGYPGYTISTISRRDARTGLPRDFPMTDELLFEQGFFETLKSVAARIEAGEI